MIIDTSYFAYKPVFIPNAQTQPHIGTNSFSQAEQVQQFVNDMEYQLILNALGFEQTKELFQQFESDGAWKADALQKWKDLVDGKDDWLGLRFTQGTNKISLIAYYVFFYYIQQNWKQYSTEGITIAQAENVETVLPNEVQARAWNTFVAMYNGEIMSYNIPTFFTNWNGTGMMWGYGGIARNNKTLYQFLQDNNTVYDTSFFRIERLINTFGL